MLVLRGSTFAGEILPTVPVELMPEEANTDT
jgi:hypothetical protein